MIVEKSKISPAFVDERGSIWDLVTDNIDHVGLLISKKGSVRGKHYHKEQKQYTLVLKGRMKIITKDMSDIVSSIKEFELSEMEMILFPPYCYHSLEALEDSICVIATSKSRKDNGYEEDTFRIEL